MLSRLSPRTLGLALFSLCAALLAFGLYLQHVQGIEPCPMCIMQRYAMAACGLIGLVAGLHNPKGRGLFLYAGLLGLAALAGGGVAARQSWLQWFPPSVSECGPGLEYMLESFPLASALPMIFRGAGDCSAIDWTFLGLSIANWSFVVFALILAALAGFLLQRRAPRAWATPQSGATGTIPVQPTFSSHPPQTGFPCPPGENPSWHGDC